jgi:pimeloyl-ACP methyl ester carboxylesterase
MDFKIEKSGGFEYVSEGNGKVLLLLHGLFGALSNWGDVLKVFSRKYRVVIPLMPIYVKTQVGASLEAMQDYVRGFMEYMQIDRCSLLGNSLGGHIALMYALKYPQQVETLVLTGSSGLFESGMGSTFPKRGSYQYVKERVEYTFYSAKTATKELIDEVYTIVNDNYRTLRVLRIARSAQRHNMRKDIVRIQPPTLLVWGLNDNITPPHVGHEFHKLIPNSELRFIDHCGHAPMMEQPQEFNRLVEEFLNQYLS